MAGTGLKGWTRKKDGGIKWTAANKAKIAKGAQKRFVKQTKKSAAAVNRMTARHNRSIKAVKRSGLPKAMQKQSIAKKVGTYKAKLQRISKGRGTRAQMARALRGAV